MSVLDLRFPHQHPPVIHTRRVNRISQINIIKASSPRLLQFQRPSNALLAGTLLFRYLVRVNRLTKQEQLVLCVVLGLLLTGWAVKTYRAAHPPAAVTRVAAP